MGEEFKELYRRINVDINAENDLYNLMIKAVGRKFKFIDSEGVEYEIYVEYFRGFSKIGVVHINSSESVSDEWDIIDFYEIIKDSVEIA